MPDIEAQWLGPSPLAGSRALSCRTTADKMHGFDIHEWP
jgi:hypothetical protein